MPTLLSPKIQKRIERIRETDLESGNYHLCTEGNDLDRWIKHFFDKNQQQKHFPAVDLACGLGVLTTNFALRYREPIFPATLDWYPTDWKEEKETRVGLEHLAQEAAEAATLEPLFCDSNNDSVYANDIVVIQGLSAAKEFNGRNGKILHEDPKTEGR